MQENAVTFGESLIGYNLVFMFDNDSKDTAVICGNYLKWSTGKKYHAINGVATTKFINLIELS